MRLALIFLAIIAVVNCEYVTFIKKTNTNKAADNSKWWKTALFYQIYPRSFKDNTNDGIGDLAGIIEKLPYLAAMNVTGVWLSPIFASPQVDQGYDISDYRTVDPDYGTNEDLKELVEKAHALGLKVILDFVPNHTSDQHEWFLKSVNRTKGYEDYYIWNDGRVDKNGTRSAPNNWISNFKGSAWEWNEERQQYYLHQFASAQPDLNYRNEKVVQELHDILTFWLDFGIDGFRVDAVPHLVEDEDLRDEPLSEIPGYGPNDYEYLDHIYTTNLNETYDIIYGFRDLLDQYTAEKGGDQRIMMTEAYTTFENTLRYMRSDDKLRLGAHFSFNFDLITNLQKYKNDTARTIFYIYEKWNNANFEDGVTALNWVLGNHDNHRVATRLGVENVDGYNMLTAILEGIQVTYNGEEIGQEDGEVTCEEGHDPQAIKNCTTFDQVSRDFERTPFQWDSSVNAGFNTGAKPWLPVSKMANETNLEFQNVQGIKSHYNTYLALHNMRRILNENELLSVGSGLTYGVHREHIFQYQRFYTLENGEYNRYVIMVNFSDEEETVYLYNASDDKNEVAITSTNSKKNVGDALDLNAITLEPHETIIIRTWNNV